MKLEVSLLFIMVRNTDTDDYKNLSRITNYIQGTIDLTLILSIEKSRNIKWYVDAEFAMQKDTSRQTGDFITMRTGGSIYISV